MNLYRIFYSKKYRKMGVRLHGRHCVSLVMATGKPKNVLVKFRGGELIVVPSGNLYFISKFRKGECRTLVSSILP